MPDAPHLIYFADPMCSWCWGFAPTIAGIASAVAEPLPVRLILGGLRPGTTEPMDEAARGRTRSHWEHVRDASGQPFDFRFFERPRFVYDTDPAARAVVILRGLRPGRELDFLARVQQAFYAENRDVTDTEILVGLAAEFGVEEAEFRAAMESAQARAETWEDYRITQATGVRGFPTLIAGTGRDNRYTLITQGFQPPAHVAALLESWQRQERAA